MDVNMKILHTSDLHLGIHLYMLNMVFEQKKLIDILCNAVKKTNAKCLIIAGDIFDSSVASAEAVNLWSEIVTALCLNMKISVIVCAGNHDSSSRLASCNELLKATGLFITGQLEYDIKPVNIGNTSIYTVPFFNLADAQRVYKCNVKTIAEAMKIILDKIRLEMDTTKCNILVSHCFVTGAQASESDMAARTSISVGGIDNIPANIFEGFDYIALGHIHKAQTILNNIRYCGTPNAYSFSEAMQNKSLSVFDTNDKTITELPILPMFKLRTLTDTYENLSAYAKTDKNRDDYMKIEITDRNISLLTHAKFKELYPNILNFSSTLAANSSGANVSAKEIASSDMVSLFKTYYSVNHDNNEPDDEIIEWFKEALEMIENNE